MRSMTGYGKHVIERDGRLLQIELKSVNHRFLDLNIKLNRAHNFAEGLIRKLIQASVTRGHIDVYVTYSDNRENKTELAFNNSLAKAYIAIADKISQEAGLISDYTVSCLMREPDVISEMPLIDDETLINDMYIECVKGAIRELNALRETEGEAIKKELTIRAEEMRRLLDIIAKRAPEVFNDYKIKLRERIEEALAGVSIDESRLLNEVAFFSDKGAIDEEIARLTTHIKSFEELLSVDEAAGRKLDFLVQELNRESNTIGSKANDIAIVNQVLNLKAEIEKIREQVQNIE